MVGALVLTELIVGMTVDVLPMREVKALTPYQAVIAGSAINAGAWLSEIKQFMQTHRTALAQKPFASFLVCMTRAVRNADQYRSHVATWLAPVRVLVRPISEGFFAGALDIKKIPSLGGRLKFRLGVLFDAWQEGDHRDWNAIHRWVLELKTHLSA